MEITFENILLPEGTFKVEVIKYIEEDRLRLKNIYYKWRELSTELRSMSGRGINLPEVLSESAFCLEMGAVRVISSISGANSSWDCYDIKRDKRIQIKACSVLPDLTSFGPKSQWDELYFMDFFRKGNWDGSFDIYFIPNELVYEHKVNERQTLKDQQQQGKRPRFSIFKELIIPNNIKPLKTGNLSIQ